MSENAVRGKQITNHSSLLHGEVSVELKCFDLLRNIKSLVWSVGVSLVLCHQRTTVSGSVILLAKPVASSGISQSGLNFSGGYFPQLGRSFALDVSDMTLRSILNKVVKESPLARMWAAKKYSTSQEFFIRLKAVHPDALAGADFDIPEQ